MPSADSFVSGYSFATFDDLEKAIHPIEQVLTEQSTLLRDGQHGEHPPAALRRDARGAFGGSSAGS